jgi:hypothetical protein
MRIGRIFDIDIYISKYLLLLTAVLIIMGRSGNITAIFFIFLLHEMSHVLAVSLLPAEKTIKVESPMMSMSLTEILNTLCASR